MYRLLVVRSDDGFLITAIDPAGTFLQMRETIWRRHRSRAVRAAIDAILERLEDGWEVRTGGVGFLVEDMEIPK